MASNSKNIAELLNNETSINTGDINVSTNLDITGGTVRLDGDYPTGSENVALGNAALDSGSLSGSSNTAIGSSALTANTTGVSNTATGRVALGANVGGTDNSAFGKDALATNVSGNFNTAIGSNALLVSTTSSNTAVGYQAGYSNSNGSYNTAIGDNALRLNVSASNNTAVGQGALYSSVNANNTAVGLHAGYYVVGNDNVHLGYLAGRGLASPGSNSLNVYIGSQVATNQAGSTGQNVAIGYAAAQNLTTTGGNTFVGANSGQNNTNGWSTGFGYYALQQNTTGNLNTAVGVYASRLNTIGVGNVSMGYQALNNNQTGSYSVAIGYNALVSCTNSYNVAIGTNAGYASVGVVAQTFVGHEAGRNVTSGGNTAVGYFALHSAGGAGTYNTALGQNAGYNHNGANGVFIGYDSRPGNTGGSHEIVIGTSSATGKGSSTGFIYPSTGGVYQGNNSSTWSTTSDERLKKNIVDNTEGLNKINAIRVRNFEYRTVEEITDTELVATDVIEISGTQLGVIAQELETVCPNAVKTESTGVKSVNTDALFWHMLNAIKELSTKNDALEDRIATLESN